MATVGNLNINVNAKTARFNKKMKGVRGSLKKFGSGLAKIGKKVALFGVAIAAVALTALTALTIKGLAAVDSMAKLAQSIGATTNSIQVLRHIAVIGGASIETMDKSLLKMTKNIGEAAQGYSEATETLEILGLTALDLEKMSPEKAFGTIADAMNQLSTDARRADAAQSIFGKGGMQLLPVFRQGSKEIARMTKMVKEFGMEIGDNQARMVERANDRWADTKFILGGLGNLLAVEIAPILEAINILFQDMVKNMGGVAKVANAIIIAFEAVGIAVIHTIGFISSMWSQFTAGLIGGAGDVAALIGELTGNLTTQMMADAMHAEAIQIMIDEDDFKKKLEFYERKFIETRRRLQEEGFGDAAGILSDGTLDLSDSKGIIDNLQTAIGAFKVEGSVAEKQRSTQITIEKGQLDELKAIRQVVASGGGVLV